MLEDIDHMIVDLQDIGSRPYTYIYTLALTMDACGEKDVDVIVLDRPNPINGERIEGNILEKNFQSFVGMFPMPMRHGLTLGEFAFMSRNFWNINCNLQIIPMKGWNRKMYFEDTELPWVFPSPNLPNIDTALIYPGSVLFEGTNISEGRGTTKSLEIIGHPHIEPELILPKLEKECKAHSLSGFRLRPAYFTPTFHKYAGRSCGGFQIHVTDRDLFTPWKLGQVLCHELKSILGDEFKWKEPPFEYEYDKVPIDLLNGSDKLRNWIDRHDHGMDLDALENRGMDEYLGNREEILLY
jgi:uncharacterized protein YbbC (DUF1343 family)